MSSILNLLFHRISHPWEPVNIPFFALTGRAHLGGLPAAVLDPYPYPVRALLLVGGSPFLSFPNPAIWKRVYESLDFLAVVDCFLSEEAAWADVILPVAIRLVGI